MSAYIFDNRSSSSMHDRRQQYPHQDSNYNYASYGGMAPPPAPSMMVSMEHQYYAGATYQQQPQQHPEFVCNVSDDDTVERDIDLEIEARMRSLTFLSDDENVLSVSMGPVAKPASATTNTTNAGLPRTMSQRMLLSLQKNKLKQSQRTERSTSNAVRQKPATHTVVPAPFKSESAYYEHPDLQVGHLETGRPTTTAEISDDLRGTKLSGRSSSSCAERLEARISKSFLNRQDSISSMYSGRRTYPAESVKKNDQRLSEGTPLPAHPETSMMVALERERAAQITPPRDTFGARVVEPLVEKVHQEKKQDAGISFHFYGGSSTTSSPMRHNRLALTMEADPARYSHQQSHAMVVPTRSSSMLDPKYTVLANQLGDIEKLIDGIESCLNASTFQSLASMVLGELDLLKGSTKQIRTNGTTLILAEVGRPPSETANALRRLVARAAAVQNRIEVLMTTIQGVVA